MEFKNADLLITSTKLKQSHVASPHCTKVVLLPKGDLKFPLKADYDRVNTPLFDQSVVNCDDNAISMAHPFVGPGRGLSIWPDQDPVIGPEHALLEETGEEIPEAADDDVVETADRKATRTQEEIDQAFKRDVLPTVRNGIANDQEIYVQGSTCQARQKW